MKLLLIRHGETSWNIEKKIQGSSDIELNENGISQAAQVGLLLKMREFPISAIYTSHLKRAQKTADIIGAQLSLPVITLSGLEEMNLGRWEGCTWDTVKSTYKDDFDNWQQNRRYARTPEGESYQDVLDRFIPALKKIISQSEDDAVVVTHSGNILALLSYINDTPFHEMLKRYRTPNTAVVEVSAEKILR